MLHAAVNRLRYRLNASGVGFCHDTAACMPIRSTVVEKPASFASNPGLTAQNDALGLKAPLFRLKSDWKLQPDRDVAAGSSSTWVASGRW